MSSDYHQEYRIAEVWEVARDLKRLVFERELASEPGNFVMLWLPGVAEKPFSVMGDEPLELGIKRVGPFTEEAFRLEPGDSVMVRGPLGNSFTDYAREGARKHLVCGGFGSVPLYFLANRLCEENVTMLAGARTREDLPGFLDDECIRVTEDGSGDFRGKVTDYMSRLDAGKGDQFFICGPERMMARAAEEASGHVDEGDIMLSMERYMKCGGRGCGSCEVDGYLTCLDGPVFPYSMLKGGDFGKRKRLSSGRRVQI